ncbi:carbamoyl-phosphate synthase small subunit, partial [Streptococcus suis]
ILGIADIDTRKLTRILRDKGAQNGCIIAGSDIDESKALAAAQAFPGLKGMDLAKVVSTKENFQWNESSWTLGEGFKTLNAADEKFHVVAYD